MTKSSLIWIWFGVPRQIFHDGLEHMVETRHSVLLCLFFCPIGIAAHLITKLLTRAVRFRLIPQAQE